MFSLFRLPFVFLKLAVFAVVVVVVWMRFPTRTEGITVPHIVQAVLRIMEWMVEQLEKLH